MAPAFPLIAGRERELANARNGNFWAQFVYCIGIIVKWCYCFAYNTEETNTGRKASGPRRRLEIRKIAAEIGWAGRRQKRKMKPMEMRGWLWKESPRRVTT